MKGKKYSSSQQDVQNVFDEYSSCEEMCAPAKEYISPSEYRASDPSKEYTPSGTFEKSEDESIKSNTKKIILFMKTAAALSAVTVVFASYGTDYIKGIYGIGSYSVSETENSSGDSSLPSFDTEQDAEKADGAFPSLKNLEPNGVTDTPYGVLDEEFICISHPATNESEYILVNDSDTYNTVVNIEGISYDKASNTLTLNNYSGDRLVANLMGNGFKLRLVGENSLQQILIWGFYYGGSLTVTGDGSLTVNKAKTEDYGIFFESESSQTCLMIDKDVSLDIYGTTSAVFVKETTMEQSIYYLSPLVLSGGIRKSEQENGLFCGYIADESGKYSTHVTFRPKE